MDSIHSTDVTISEAESSVKEKVDKPKLNKSMYEKGKMRKLYAGAKQKCCTFLEEFKIHEGLEKMSQYLEASPLLACGLFAILVGLSIPIVLFVLFSVVNVAFVIAGFIILEVTIFIIGATVLASSVFFVITTAAIIGLCVLSFYLIFCYLIILLKKFRV